MPAPVGLDGRQFLSVSVKDDGADKPLFADTRISLTFSDGRLGAQAGCNSMSGPYTLDGQVLLVGNMATTEMGCQPDLMTQDQWLAGFLGSGPQLSLDGNDLVLTSGTTVITLLDREVAQPDQPLVGPLWTLDSIITGDAVSSVPVGASGTIQFGADGRVQIFDGCNSGGGSYAVDGDVIQFDQIALSAMACDGTAAELEQAFVQVFDATSMTFVIDADSLTLQAGANGLIFRAATSS